MTHREWKDLETMKKGDFDYEHLLEKTSSEEEHPEWYNGPCMCELCRSYSD